MQDIYILTDYRNRFGSKRKEAFFRSGFDLELLGELFKGEGYRTQILQFVDVDFRTNWQDRIVIYTSSEDSKGHYKSYIEDVIYGLEQAGAKLIPRYSMLKAHNNKVFMEILRDLYLPEDRIVSHTFGTIEELESKSKRLVYPVVFKSYEGAVSRYVRMCYGTDELISVARKLMRSPSYVYEVKERYRSMKYPPYRPESSYRKKAIVQNMIENLSNDWKILVFGDKLYKLKRQNRKGDYRASGSGLFTFDRVIDEGMLDFALDCYRKFDVPVASFDIAKDKDGYILIEFQFIYFGTKTLEDSDHYYTKVDGKWAIVDKDSILEEEFVRSCCFYLRSKGM